MVLRKSFYIRWSAGRSPRVHEVNPGRDPSIFVAKINVFFAIEFISTLCCVCRDIKFLCHDKVFLPFNVDSKLCVKK